MYTKLSLTQKKEKEKEQRGVCEMTKIKEREMTKKYFFYNNNMYNLLL